MMPRKPDDGGVGSSGQDVTDCNQFHMDQSDSEMCLFYVCSTLFLKEESFEKYGQIKPYIYLDVKCHILKCTNMSKC